jgi:hypothetical protein
MGRVKALEMTSCKYPIRRIEVKVDTVPRGNMNYVQANMFLGQLPKRLVIGCVDSDALNGAITIKPFDFKHYKINFVALNVDGRQIPAKPLQHDFENAGYIHATNHQSFRQLSQKHVGLDVIHVATGNRIYFDFYTSDGVFTAGHFQSFYATHSYGRT